MAGKKQRIQKTMDGNEAAAYIAYAFTEVATIYPITPSSPMAEAVDEWSANGRLNLFGQRVKLVEMQSEAGAVGAMHGSLETGALTTSFTSSQGLLLMIPTLYRLAGQLKPGVLHVSARTVGTHAFSIFGEHSDVMACRQTGMAMLCTDSVQENMDLAAIAHLAAIKGRVPFIHFFDGFRTSHEIQKVDVIDYEELKGLIDQEALDAFRKSSLNPERPVMRSTVMNPDVYFQTRESANPFYQAIPGIVEYYMNKINKMTGRDYRLFNYYGAADADRIIIAMGSSAGVIRETVEYLNSQGEKVGFLEVHLYRPFSIEHFLKELPDTVKKVTVLDRTKEPGSLGEPLYLDVCGAFNEVDNKPQVYGGRYGLSIKDVTPNQIVAVFDNMKKYNPKNHFTVGIDDDVTFTSLKLGAPVDVLPKSTKSLKFWGLGSDGTVGANKNSIKIIGDNTNKYVQAYFEYDTKKSGGITRSHLRFGDEPIIGSYLVTHADFVACHNQSYMDKYDIVQELKPGGTFLLNTMWTPEELETKLSNKVKRYLAQNDISFYTIDALKIGKEIGLGKRTNAILQAAFFKLADIIPIEDAVGYMKDAVLKSYGHKGDKVVNMNNAAIDQGVKNIVKIDIPESWKDLPDDEEKEERKVPAFVKNIVEPIDSLHGDDLPVSAFKGMEDGTVPLGTSQYEKRGTAVEIPVWNPDKCIQCNQCSFSCPHAAIRPFLLDHEETAEAPDDFVTVRAKGKGMEAYTYRIQVSPLDCLSCGVCFNACPAEALSLSYLEREQKEVKNWEFATTITHKDNPMDKFTVKGSQFEQPLVEFSGACAGCGETAYVKTLTQLFGDRLIIANATGCTQAWGAAMPSFPYTVNDKGFGPAWSNSLFENNAEFAMGMSLAEGQQRARLAEQLLKLKEISGDPALNNAIDIWWNAYDEGEKSLQTTEDLEKRLQRAELSGEANEIREDVLLHKEHLTKKSIWMYGGDGWAYDIGYGGLDHVLASGEDVNVLLVDTEVYSNTGGQASKASPIGAVAQFAASGKKTNKKDLGLHAMAYGTVYVAQCAMGADKNQFVRAMKEAEAFHGPSLIICYAPCINHGLVKGMGMAQIEMKRAVESGYWNLYRYNPELTKQNKDPFLLDSKEPTMELKDFMMGEVRFASLYRKFPEEAEKLLKEAEKYTRGKRAEYVRMASGGDALARIGEP